MERYRYTVVRNVLLTGSCLLAVVGFIVNAEAQTGPKVVVPSEETGNPAVNPETPNTTIPDEIVPPLEPPQRVLNEEKSGTTEDKTIDGRSDTQSSPTTPRRIPAWNRVDGKAD